MIYLAIAAVVIVALVALVLWRRGAAHPKPTDDLGAIAAANGLQRAFLVAHLVNEFPETQEEILGKSAAGQFVYLHHAIALVVNARINARAAGKKDEPKVGG